MIKVYGGDFACDIGQVMSVSRTSDRCEVVLFVPDASVPTQVVCEVSFDAATALLKAIQSDSRV